MSTEMSFSVTSPDTATVELSRIQDQLNESIGPVASNMMALAIGALVQSREVDVASDLLVRYIAALNLLTSEMQVTTKA